MSERDKAGTREGEAVPVPDKGGWIDDEMGRILPTPPPEDVAPVKEPEPAKRDEPKAPTVPRKAS